MRPGLFDLPVLPSVFYTTVVALKQAGTVIMFMG